MPLIYPVSKPASYPETVAVAGSNAMQQPWKDSSNGALVDVSAPAENIRRARAGWVNLTEHVNDTDQSEGTSMAVSLAASVAALWVSYHGYENLLAHYQEPKKIPAAFRKIIQTQGARQPEIWPANRFGTGLLDAERVLQAALPEI
jgi:hypothetical protein